MADDKDNNNNNHRSQAMFQSCAGASMSCVFVLFSKMDEQSNLILKESATDSAWIVCYVCV
jgi:hypothetical protein